MFLNKKSLTLFIILFSIFCTSKSTQASNSNFSVNPIYPSTQDKGIGDSGYFMLNMNPDQKEVLEIEVNNYSNEKIKILIQANRVLTSDTGVLLYDPVNNKKASVAIDDNFNFDKMIGSYEKEVTLEAKETNIISIPIQTPKKKFSGEVLGGIHFREINPKEKEDKKMVTNTFSYSIPIIIREDKTLIPNKLSLGNIEANLRNYHPYIDVNIKNSSLSIIRNMNIDGEIYNLDSKKKWYVSKISNMQMAPYSDFNFGFDLKDTEILPGKYEAKLNINADGKKYVLNKKFSISNSTAEEKNEKSVFVDYTNKDKTKYYVTAFALLILFLLIFLYVSKKKRAKKEYLKKKKSKRRK